MTILQICRSSSDCLWFLRQISFSLAAECLIEALSQEFEQFFREPELQLLAGIYFFHPSFEPALCGFCSGSESNNKCSIHNALRIDRSEGKVCRFR